MQTESDSTKQHGVSPAFLLDTSKILFSTNVETISDSHNAYKLTLLDSSIKTSVLTPGEGFLRIDTDHKVTVPYEVTGAASGNMTMSVLVTNGAYTDAGSSIVYYQEAESNEDGTVSFPWNDKWDGNYSADKYHIYLIAEQRQDGYATDRASKPVELPPVKKEINKVNLQFTAPFENDEQVEMISETAASLSTLTIESVNEDHLLKSVVTAAFTEVKDGEGKESAQFHTSYQAAFRVFTVQNSWYVFAKSGVTADVTSETDHGSA